MKTEEEYAKAVREALKDPGQVVDLADALISDEANSQKEPGSCEQGIIPKMKALLSRTTGPHESALLTEAISQLEADARFRSEWSDRFGFLAEVNPRDSFASIDEVATLIDSQQRAADDKITTDFEDWATTHNYQLVKDDTGTNPYLYTLTKFAYGVWCAARGVELGK